MQNYFSINSSRTLAVLLLVIHGFAAAALVLLPAPLWSKAVAGGALLCSLVYYLCHDAWLCLPTACVAFRLDKSRVVLIFRNGREQSGQLQGDSVVMPFIILLRVLPQDALLARSLVIFQDAIAPEPFRELRVALRWNT